MVQAECWRVPGEYTLAQRDRALPHRDAPGPSSGLMDGRARGQEDHPYPGAAREPVKRFPAGQTVDSRHPW